MRPAALLCLLAGIAACGPAVWLQTDDFPDRLKAGCSSLAECEALETQATAGIHEIDVQLYYAGNTHLITLARSLVVVENRRSSWKENNAVRSG